MSGNWWSAHKAAFASGAAGFAATSAIWLIRLLS